jgi:hypothetical protein
LKSVRANRAATALASMAGLVFVLAGCGGGGDSADAKETSRAVVGLYVIDHSGARPRGDALAPYTEAFRQVQAGCEGSPSDLASDIFNVANAATNGSGVTITNLKVMRAVAAAVGTTQEDCAGLLVGVEARLEGSALSG